MEPVWNTGGVGWNFCRIPRLKSAYYCMIGILWWLDDWMIGILVWLYIYTHDDYNIGIWYIGMIIIYQYCNIKSENIPISLQIFYNYHLQQKIQLTQPRAKEMTSSWMDQGIPSYNNRKKKNDEKRLGTSVSAFFPRNSWSFDVFWMVFCIVHLLCWWPKYRKKHVGNLSNSWIWTLSGSWTVKSDTALRRSSANQFRRASLIIA